MPQMICMSSRPSEAIKGPARGREYECCWAGYELITWESASNLKNNLIFNEYIQVHPLQPKAKAVEARKPSPPPSPLRSPTPPAALALAAAHLVALKRAPAAAPVCASGKRARTSRVLKGHVAYKGGSGSCVLRIHPCDNSEFNMKYEVLNESEVDVLEESNGYYLVKYKHMQGYMKTAYLCQLAQMHTGS